MQEAEKKKNEPVDDSQVIDDVFGYLENEDEKDVKREPSAFKDLPQKKRRKSEVLIGVPSAPEDNEDLTEFSFQKFAKTYFQGDEKSKSSKSKTVTLHCIVGNVTHQYSRRLIKHSLLPLNSNGDKAVSVNLLLINIKY